jgi:uncharacterized integral membrane protein
MIPGLIVAFLCLVIVDMLCRIFWWIFVSQDNGDTRLDDPPRGLFWVVQWPAFVMICAADCIGQLIIWPIEDFRDRRISRLKRGLPEKTKDSK